MLPYAVSSFISHLSSLALMALSSSAGVNLRNKDLDQFFLTNYYLMLARLLIDHFCQISAFELLRQVGNNQNKKEGFGTTW